MTYRQHQYRKVFLKSREWKKVRSARMKLVRRENGGTLLCECCKVPLEGRWRNGHHVEYPDDWYATTADQLRIVCVPCHAAIHKLLDQYALTGSIADKWSLTLAGVQPCIQRQQKWWHDLQGKRLARACRKLVKKKRRTDKKQPRLR